MVKKCFRSLLFILTAILGLCAVSQQNSAPAPEDRYKPIIAKIDASRIAKHIRTLSSMGSRIPGYPGESNAAAYVENQLRAMGVPNITTEEVEITTPVDEGSSITLGGKKITLNAMWPNLVRTSQLPPEGLTGPLVYVGDCKLERFNGKKIEGSICIADFNSGMQWLNAPRLGAKAVIFIEPATTMRGEAEAKFISISINTPRFWISRSEVVPILSKLSASEPPTVTLKCQMPWKKTKAKNIIATIPAPETIPNNKGEQVPNPFKDQYIVVSGFYDSISVVPSLAPGAETACGMATMLELTRYWMQKRPYRPVILIASAGHFQAMAGMRDYLDKNIDKWSQLSLGDKLISRFTGKKPPEKNIYLWTTFDISSQSRAVGGFYKGFFYNQTEVIQKDFSEIGRMFREIAENVAKLYGLDGKKIYVDGCNAIEGKTWTSFLPAKLGLDCEPVNLGGGKAITFATANDSRTYVDTPLDTYDKINIPNVVMQAKTLSCLFESIMYDSNDSTFATPGKFIVSSPASFTRMSPKTGFSTLEGRVVRFDPERSFVPNTPITNNLELDGQPLDKGATVVVARTSVKSYTGVRGCFLQMVDDSVKSKEAFYQIKGVPAVTAGGGIINFAAYHVNGSHGDITYAPDMGTTGGEDYPLELEITAPIKSTPIVVFRCVPTTIYDLVDPQSLNPLNGVNTFDGETNGTPRMFGFNMASKSQTTASYVENVAVLFSTPGSRLKIIMGVGLGDVRLLLINMVSDKEDGIGYLVAGDPREAQGFKTMPRKLEISKNERIIARGGAISRTAYWSATDFHAINEWRLSKLRKHKIDNQGVNELHDLSQKYLDAADKAYAINDYSTADAYSRAAWAYSARAYPNIKSTANDVVSGVIFYLALLIPFAYFLERLLIASRNLSKQLLWASIFFIITFIILQYIHPAFEITGNPVVVFIAFIMGALSLIVSTFIIGKFNQNIRELNKRLMGVHTADIGRMSVAFAAFTLGVSNMRRRKARTFLTCLTLVLVTFIVLSFTSIVNVLRFNEIPSKGIPRYNGLMIRTLTWGALPEPTYSMLRDEFGPTYRPPVLGENLKYNPSAEINRTIAPRAWFFGSGTGESSNIAVKRADRQYDARAIVGLIPEEKRVTKPHEALIAGRWFEKDDVYTAIIPRQMANSLRIDVQDVGKAKIAFTGTDYTVIGIIDNNKFKSIVRDLDDETITPVDFAVMSRMQSQEKGAGEESEEQEYIHLEPDTVMFIPYNTAMNIGANIYSVAISYANAEETYDVMKMLMPRLSLNIYGVRPEADGKASVVRYSTIAGQSSRGMEMIVIPIIIAAIIVLNTMIGAVYERVKEIGIFSAIGLAPNHIAMLFFAESLVFAILGSVAGYFLAQGVAKIIVLYNIQGLYLNFSSTSAVLATIVVVGVVLASTIYPARKASQVATPAVDRKWKAPEPNGDNWRIPLPFSVTGPQAAGLSGFIWEWLSAYEEYSIGDFVTKDVQKSTAQGEYGTIYRVTCTAWIAPFDLGVSQNVAIESVPTEMKDVYELYVVFDRLTGDVASWKRVNQRFINTLRKQFLIWRTLRSEQRDKYLADVQAAPALGD